MISHKDELFEAIKNKIVDLEFEHLIILDDFVNSLLFLNNGYSNDNRISPTEKAMKECQIEENENNDEPIWYEDYLGNFTTDLMAIVKESNAELVKYILSNCKNIKINSKNEYGITPLMWACAFNSSFEVIEELIKHMAKINDIDKNGRTALHHLAKNLNGHLILPLLIEANADLNINDYNKGSPINLAVKEENYEITYALLKAGADIKNLNL